MHIHLHIIIVFSALTKLYIIPHHVQGATYSESKQGQVVEDKQDSEVSSKKPKKLVDGCSEEAVTQDENPNDAVTRCDQCGQILQLYQTHFMQDGKCTGGSAESVKCTAKPTPPVHPQKAPAGPTKAITAETEDLPICEDTPTVDELQQKSESSTPDLTSKWPVKVPLAATEELSSSFDEQYLKSGTDNASQLCMWKWTEV